MNTELDCKLRELLPKLEREDEIEVALLVEAIMDTRESMRSYMDGHSTRPRIEVYQSGSPFEPSGANLAKVASERDQYRHDFATMADRAAELSVQVATLEAVISELTAERDMLRRALDGVDR